MECYGAETAKIHRLTSTREEMLGILCANYVIASMIDKWGYKGSKEVKIVTDSKAAIAIRKESKSEFVDEQRCMQNEMDVEYEIISVEKEYCKNNVNYVWIKGHQKIEETNKKSLAHLNSRADYLATQAREEVKMRMRKPIKGIFFDSMIAAVTVEDETIQNDLKETIKIQLNLERLKKFMLEKYQWDEKSFDLIQWDGMGRAMKSFRHVKKISIAKIMTGWQCSDKWKKKMATGHTTKLNNQNIRNLAVERHMNDTEMEFLLESRKAIKEGEENQLHDGKCKLCGEVDSPKHMFCCQDPRMQKVRKAGWNKLKRQVRGCTHPTILTQIYQGLHSYTYSHEPEMGPVLTMDEECTVECFNEQTEIGWDHMYLGRIGSKWGAANEELTRDYKRPIDSVTWSARVIKILLNNALELWGERNQAIHGKSSCLANSEEEIRQIKAVTKLFYKYVKPLALPQEQWLFQQSERIKQKDNPNNLVAWIDAVERECLPLVRAFGLDYFFKQRRLFSF